MQRSGPSARCIAGVVAGWMNAEPSPIDFDKLKQDITDAVRQVIRELAAERGMSRDESLDWLFDTPDDRHSADERA